MAIGQNGCLVYLGKLVCEVKIRFLRRLTGEHTAEEVCEAPNQALGEFGFVLERVEAVLSFPSDGSGVDARRRKGSRVRTERNPALERHFPRVLDLGRPVVTEHDVPFERL